MRRYADKRDANEAGIIKYLRRCGCQVRQLSQKGIPDLMVSSGPLGPFVVLMEIKNDKGTTTDDQDVFFKQFGNSFVYLVYSKTDAKNILREFMPVRIYECPEHGLFEKKQAFYEEPLDKCPKCGKIVKQKYSIPYVVYKGSGWAGKNNDTDHKPQS